MGVDGWSERIEGTGESFRNSMLLGKELTDLLSSFP
jgi:hypothetical protein